MQIFSEFNCFRPFLSSMGGIAPGLPNAVLSDKPLRFTDSPQHYATGTGSNVPTPNPRRKMSTASNDNTYSPEMQRIDRLPPVYMDSSSAFPDYGPPGYTLVPSDYYNRLQESVYNAPTDYKLVYIKIYIKDFYL